MTYTQKDQQGEIKIARIYMRVSTDEQDLTRQEQIEKSARASGYHIAGVYREKASGARADRPELQRMICDLQPGETLIAEKIDRLSRLPLPEAEKLIHAIKDRGVKISIPGIVDLSELVATSEGVTKIVVETVQDLILKIALQMAHDDYMTRRLRQEEGIAIAREKGLYRGRRPNKKQHALICELRKAGHTISKTAELAGCSTSQVKLVTAAFKKSGG